jgi:hypothetical protein
VAGAYPTRMERNPDPPGGDPPPVAENANKTQRSQAAEDWSLEIRNAGIRVEVDFRELNERIAALRKQYRKQARRD